MTSRSNPIALFDRPRLLRAGLLVVVVALLVSIGYVTGIRSHLNLHGLRELVRGAGPWGVVVFLLAATLGGVLHLPGVVFLAVGPLLYGKVLGGALALCGALLYANASFALIRGVGGQPLAAIERPFFRAWLGRLERHPIRATALMRSVFWMAAPANYTLALSSIRPRDHLIGSVLGLAPAAAVCAALVDWLWAS